MTTSNPSREHYPWLFSPVVDLSVFLGSALVSLLLLWVGAFTGALYSDTPDWAWVPAILLVDVAHVYSTAFRVYFVPNELKRNWLLYVSVPTISFIFGVVIHRTWGPAIFWRTLAYLAVFHFIRQQYGWVALYRAKANEKERWTKWIDTTTIYLATIYPLVFWHTHLPRNYAWFLPDNFLVLPEFLNDILEPVYWMSLFVYAVRSFWSWRLGRPNPGKDVVVLTTAVCWYVGIVAFDSDYAFTVTNVIIHGVPYLALVYWYWRINRSEPVQRTRIQPLVIFLATIWLFAYIEELVWDRSVWQQRSWLFGSSWSASQWHDFLVPLLAVPQMTHYVLDGFIWKRRRNPSFSSAMNNE